MTNGAGHNESWDALRKGNRDALLTLYNTYHVGLLNYGCKLTGDRAFTNDCITQVLLRLWDRRRELPPVENLRSYLLTCLRRELFSQKKSENAKTLLYRKMQDQTDTQEISYEERIVSLQADTELKEKLARSLAKLTAREKELIRLKFFEDLSYEEIASQCGITKRTVYNSIYHAIKTLKEEFSAPRARPAGTEALLREPTMLLLVCLLSSL